MADKDGKRRMQLRSMGSSLKRGFSRYSVLALIGGILLSGSNYIPHLLGATGAPLAFGFGLAFMGLAVGDFSLRILQPRIDPQQAAVDGIQNRNVAAAIVYLGRCILAAVILMLVVTASRAAQVPPVNAKPYIPILVSQQQIYWGDLSFPSVLGSQVEQETCYTLTAKGCWNPNAELKTAREQGIGLGQITRTFTVTGATNMDSLHDLKRAYPKELANLTWDHPFDPTLQLRALVLKDRQGYNLIQDTHSEYERLAMTFAAYNGGNGGLSSDRRACAGTKGCDPSKWFNNVALTSLKSKVALPGYGQSFFEGNRTYVQNVMVVRRGRYLSMDDAVTAPKAMPIPTVVPRALDFVVTVNPPPLVVRDNTPVLIHVAPNPALAAVTIPASAPVVSTPQETPTPKAPSFLCRWFHVFC